MRAAVGAAAARPRSEEISKRALNAVRGVEHHERIDEALYQDYESEEARKVRRVSVGRVAARRQRQRRAPSISILF